MVDVDIHVASVSGPLFDMRSFTIMAAYAREAEATIAGQALSFVQQRLDEKIRFPTPYYETQVMVQDFGAYHLVHDRRIIYGYWLEGIDSRQRTGKVKWKGYESFRRSTPKAQRRAVPLARYVWASKYVKEMNG